MNQSIQAPAPSARIAAGVKTAVLVVVLGIVALFVDVVLTAPHAIPLIGGTSVSAAMAAPTTLPTIEIPMIAWDRPSESGTSSPRRPAAPAQRPVAVDPSVPSADTVVGARGEPLPATF
ncbi:MAG: hypothetical protein ABI886_05110 [Betaproteobacteria bacterium]